MKNKKIYILFSILLVILSYSLVEKTFQNDTFSAIKIGQYILSNGIDFVEHFNIDSTLNYHNARWLFNVIVAFLYNNFSYAGIYVFVSIIFISIGLLLFNILLKKSNILISFIITIVTLIATRDFITGRAQIISYLIFILEVYFIEKLIETDKKRYILYIMIGSVVVANVHSTLWLMTLVFFLPYFAEYFLFKLPLMKRQNIFYSNTKSIKLLLIAFILCSFTGLLTPIGLTPYTYIFKTMSGISKEFILELKNTDIFIELEFFFYTVIYIILFLYFKPKIKLSDLFMFLGLYLMGVEAIRNLAYFYFISAFIICRLVTDILKSREKDSNVIVDYIINDKLIISTIAIAVCIFSFNMHSKITRIGYVDETTYPVKAADYIIKNIDVKNMKLYNGFTYGSYLEFRGIKVFLDSRSEVYCEEFNDTSILKDWYYSYSMKVYYKNVFDKYDFTHVMLYKNELLYNYVKHDKDYKNIYEDKYFVLYEKVK